MAIGFTVLTFSAAILSAFAAPAPFPLSDGFPNTTPAQDTAIGQKAGGDLPNGQLPSSLKDAAHTALELIALNEIFEVAYFTDLLANVTTGKEGYRRDDLAPLTPGHVTEILTAIIKQEELHAIGVNAILANSKFQAIRPCQFKFPVATFPNAIALANTFTDLVLAVLPQAQALFAADAGDESGLVPLLGSVIGQEGEQNGFFRFHQKKIPSAAPFLTGSAPEFAFNAIQQDFIVPGTCLSPLGDIKLKIFDGALTVVTKAEARTMTLVFSVPAGATIDPTKNSIVYLSGQNNPVTVPICSPKKHDNMITFEAEFPFDSPQRFANGLTIAALVEGTGSFKIAADVAAATRYGPGLIEVD